MSETDGILEAIRGLQKTITGLGSELGESRREMAATAENLRWLREQAHADGERIRELERRLTALESEGKARSGGLNTVLSVVGAIVAIAAVVVSLVK